jgi:hypothetical protein
MPFERTILRRCALLLLVGTSSASALAAPAAVKPGLHVPRAGHQVTLLSGGQVVVTGGCAAAGCAAIQAAVERYDPVTGHFAPDGELAQPRVSHTASALPDGRLLVAGGWTGHAATASTEWRDPQTGRFVPGPRLSSPRMDGTSTVLDSGDVLLVGGAAQTNHPVTGADRFVAATGQVAPAGDLQVPRAHHGAVKLRDGRVLVMGGLVGRNTATATAELYDPSTQNFRLTGALHTPRCKHAAVALADGRVMVLGGSADCNDRKKLAETEIYDPATGTFSPGPMLQDPRYKVANAAVVLPDGRVLIAGDANDVEVWVPGAPRFERLPSPLGASLAFSTATLLPGGDVLVVGGYNAGIVPTAQVWRLTLPPR